MRLPLATAALLAAIAIPTTAAAAVEFAPGVDAKAYRKVLITPAKVEFAREFLADAKSSRNPSLRLTEGELRQIASDMADGFSKALADAFKKRGYEVATSPGGDVLALSPALRNLFVNAPEGRYTGLSRSFTQEAGGAMMVVEGRDDRGSRVVSASDERLTSRTLGFQQTSDVTNRFWFDAMFRSYAEELAGAIAARK